MSTKEKRRDSHKIVLRVGETQMPNGTYCFRWTEHRKRNAVYAKTLDLLREKEKEISKDIWDGVHAEARRKTVNEFYTLWAEMKRGIKDNTFENYKYLYTMFVQDHLGRLIISNVKKSDVKKFYNYLTDERKLKASTIEGVHTVLHQVLQIAVDDEYIRYNPSDGMLNELKKTHLSSSPKRKALTRDEQDLFLKYMRESELYFHWYPIFAVLLGTGLRAGEVTGLRWSDIDLENGIIDVNHTLIYYCHRENSLKSGCYFNVNTPKTPESIRKVPMLDPVKEAFRLEKEYQKLLNLKCNVVIDGYTDFIFVNRFGNVQNYATLNKAIKRIIRDCNDAEFLKSSSPDILLPNFSCHSLRHTFTTRLCEAGVNIKLIQSILGHKDATTTLNIYAEVTKEMENEGLKKLSLYMKNKA